MLQLREKLRFALEARQSFLVGDKRRGKDLDRDVPFQPGVGGAPDFAHPAFTELGGDLVGAETSADQGKQPIPPERRQASFGGL